MEFNVDRVTQLSMTMRGREIGLVLLKENLSENVLWLWKIVQARPSENLVDTMERIKIFHITVLFIGSLRMYVGSRSKLVWNFQTIVLREDKLNG